jgi:hypothetical protein
MSKFANCQQVATNLSYYPVNGNRGQVRGEKSVDLRPAEDCLGVKLRMSLQIDNGVFWRMSENTIDTDFPADIWLISE